MTLLLLLFGAEFRAVDLLPPGDTSSRSSGKSVSDTGETRIKGPSVHIWQRDGRAWHRMTLGEHANQQTRGTIDRKGMWLEAVGSLTIDRVLLMPARFDAGDEWEVTFMGQSARCRADRWEGCHGGVAISMLADGGGQIDRYCPGIGVVETIRPMPPSVTYTQQRTVFDASGTRLWPPVVTDRQIDPALVGRYALRAFEMAGVLELRADGTAAIALSFGSVDPRATLIWWREGDQVRLESMTSPGLPVPPRVVGDEPWSADAEVASASGPMEACTSSSASLPDKPHTLRHAL